MVIQFLMFKGCPLATPAKKNLESALAECGISDYHEIDIMDPEVSEDLSGWGSPTILVDGRDVSGIPKGNSVCCRVYPYPEGVPDVKSIIACIQARILAN